MNAWRSNARSRQRRTKTADRWEFIVMDPQRSNHNSRLEVNLIGTDERAGTLPGAPCRPGRWL